MYKINLPVIRRTHNNNLVCHYCFLYLRTFLGRSVYVTLWHEVLDVALGDVLHPAVHGHPGPLGVLREVSRLDLEKKFMFVTHLWHGKLIDLVLINSICNKK